MLPTRKRFSLYDNKPFGIRAVGIVIHDDKILLIRRVKDGRHFHVFPGGVLETGETLQQGIAREIKEETDQDVSVGHIMYHLDYTDDSDQYFGLCIYHGGGEVRLVGEELDRQTEDNQYHPCWVPVNELANTTLFPVRVRDWLLEDYPAIKAGEKPFRHWRGAFEAGR